MYFARIPALIYSIVFALYFIPNAWANTVHFTVQTSSPETIYIIGDAAPLNMSQPLQLLSDKHRKQHKISLWFNQSPEEIKFLFATQDKQEPLKGFRTIKLNEATTYSAHIFAVPDALNSDSMQVLSPQQLQNDLQVLEQALDVLHPGLYRYQSESEWQQKLRQIKATFGQAQSLANTFVEVAELLTALQCGHTYLNPLNQHAEVERLLLGPANKLPVSFIQIDKRWYITHNYSNKSLLKPGTEIKSINGQSVTTLTQALLRYMRGDGANTAQQHAELNLVNETGLQPFDVYFPFVEQQANSTERTSYKLEVVLANTTRPLFIDVPGLTLLEREEKILASHPQTSAWSFTITANNVGVMKLPSFATYNMDFSWQAFYAESFAALKASNVQELVIDVRGNTGGLDEVSQQLASYLNLADAFAKVSYTPIIKYQDVPAELQKHLRTWDPKFFAPVEYTLATNTDFVTGYTKPIEATQKVVKLKENRQQERIPQASKVQESKVQKFISQEDKEESQSSPLTENDKPTFNGTIHLLVDGTNASSTFFLSQAMATNERVRVIGAPTGGNQKGINGGGMFFLTLPNSQIVVDIPLFAYIPKQQPLNETPNAGLTPDVLSKPTVKDVIMQKDGVLARLLASLK